MSRKALDKFNPLLLLLLLDLDVVLLSTPGLVAKLKTLIIEISVQFPCLLSQMGHRAKMQCCPLFVGSCGIPEQPAPSCHRVDSLLLGLMLCVAMPPMKWYPLSFCRCHIIMFLINHKRQYIKKMTRAELLDKQSISGC